MFAAPKFKVSKGIRIVSSGFVTGVVLSLCLVVFLFHALGVEHTFALRYDQLNPAEKQEYDEFKKTNPSQSALNQFLADLEDEKTGPDATKCILSGHTHAPIGFFVNVEDMKKGPESTVEARCDYACKKNGLIGSAFKIYDDDWDDCCCIKSPPPLEPTPPPRPWQLQIPVNGVKDMTPCTPANGGISCSAISDYIILIYIWLVGAVGILAMIAFAYAGLLWLLARGNSGQVKTAQKILTDTVAGLTLTLCSYLILYIINPNLIKLTPLFIKDIKQIDFEYDQDPNDIGGGATGDVLAFNMQPCPALSEAKNGFNAYFTTYYKPIWPDAGGYGDFWCNVSMQCSCPAGYDMTRTCSDGRRPCKQFNPNTTDYCSGGPGGAVVPDSSLAVDTNCFFVKDYTNIRTKLVRQYWGGKSMPMVDKYHLNPNMSRAGLQKCKFIIDGNASKIYTGQDTGAAIWGRHFDYFAGTNRHGGLSGVHTVKVLNPEDCLVPQ